MEMLMLQNAQMHQLVTQQTILSSLPQQQQQPPTATAKRPNVAQLRQLLSVKQFAFILP